MLMRPTNREGRTRSKGLIFLAVSLTTGGIDPVLAQELEGQEKEAGDQAVQTLEEITVVGEREEGGYRVEEATTATKTDTPIMETPASIQVVPEEVLEDQQVIRPRDALKNVSGVYSAGGNANTQDNFIIRGFQQSFIYQDGFRRNFKILPDTANLERIEVLKGPAAVLYGRIDPGGLINQVTKQPLTIPYYSLPPQFGSFDFYRTTVDATGPLAGENALLYRFNASYENTGSFRNFTDIERIFAAPVLTWNLTDRTRIRFNLEYLHSQRPFDRGVIGVDGRPLDVPQSRRFEDTFSEVKQEDIIAGFLWSHNFHPDWTLRHHFKYEFLDEDRLQGEPVALLGDNRTLTREVFEERSRFDTYFTAIELTGRVALGGMRHTLLIGADYYDSEKDGRSGFGDFPAIDIFNPVYGLPRPVIPLQPDLSTEEWYGIYFQDQIDLWEDFHLLVGARYDSAESSSTFGDFSGQDDAQEWSPRAGVVYRPLRWLALYANYAESFSAFDDFSRSFDGKSLDPETATQYEAGFKTEFWEGRLSSTLAFYNLTKKNIAAPDPDHPGFSLPIGEAESRGVEFDLSAELTPAWSVIASYAYTDAKITKDTAGKEGRRLGAPRHGGSFWTRYQFLQGPLDGLSLGAGVFAVGTRQGDLFGLADNTFQVPGYVRADLMAAYRWQIGKSTLTAQLNVENLFNREYIITAGGIDDPDLSLTPGPPRIILGSIRVEF